MAYSVFGPGSPRDVEVRHYPFLVYGLVPLVALVAQAWLPRVLGPYTWSDLPLVITLYFAMARRSPIQGTLIGVVMGTLEDALSHHALGINGIAKTVAGFLAASVGVRIDVENHTIRLLLVFLLSLVSSAIYVFIYSFLLGMALDWRWFSELFRAIGNSVIALFLFPILDRFQLQD